MYLEHFGLKEQPFSIAPNPRYLYLSQQHQEALAHLIYGLNGNGGIILLTGEVGTGKTTISRKLLEDIPEHIDIAWIVNPKLSAEELLATICDELGIQYPQNATIKTFTDLLSAHLITSHADGRNVVLMIDEAQNLSPDLLEQLRLLTNLETNERKLLQIVLLGQPELKAMLQRPELRQFAQRITARFHLHSLDRQACGHYIRHRLEVAGCSRPVFSQRAINAIYRLSHGTPRLINLICDRAMLGVFSQHGAIVQPSHVRQAYREIIGEEKPASRRAWALPLFALITCIAVAIWLLYTEQMPAPRQSAAATESKTAAPIPAPQPPQPAHQPAPPSIPWQQMARSGDYTTAFHTLATQWHLRLPDASSGDLCQAVRQDGLHCLRQRGGISALRSLNRPAIVQLAVDHQQIAHLCVTALDADQITLQLGDQQWQVPLDAFLQRWNEDFTLLWRAPPGFNGSIKIGAVGKQVQWLQARLESIQGKLFPPRNITRMDNLLADRLRDFQRQAGLYPDGTAGPLTIIRLNDAANANAPHLHAAQRRS